MAYNVKDVFYLGGTAAITKATDGSGSAQLDLSAYIDPIARGRTKGTGLAVYKVHYSVMETETNRTAAAPAATAGIMTMGLFAGAGLGDNATAGISIGTNSDTTYGAANNLNISSATYYAPASYPGATAKVDQYLMPSTEVPYVIVRDNVCLIYTIDDTNTFSTNFSVSFRMECAQITLDQATLNQLLRTQTV
tara:strand:- start:293 stop:871 length:579 start_codon:yes stop_codon:yes gene_type:complete